MCVSIQEIKIEGNNHEFKCRILGTPDLILRSVVNSGHQMSRLPSVVDRIDSQRPLGRDSPAFSGVSADCRKALCIL